LYDAGASPVAGDDKFDGDERLGTPLGGAQEPCEDEEIED
jgi:hypothetical protein